ncbi:hypothetical protein M9458_058149 [Cirrhinus mrigala]|uniref:Uncharacterized protein n=1 Tax=Cirrhinus mrigala TaxID=683832 RepID=A0ABD0MC61_CIRMR
MMETHDGAEGGRSHGGGQADDSRGPTNGGGAGGGRARGGDGEPMIMGDTEDPEGQGRARSDRGPRLCQREGGVPQSRWDGATRRSRRSDGGDEGAESRGGAAGSEGRGGVQDSEAGGDVEGSSSHDTDGDWQTCSEPTTQMHTHGPLKLPPSRELWQALAPDQSGRWLLGRVGNRESVCGGLVLVLRMSGWWLAGFWVRSGTEEIFHGTGEERGSVSHQCPLHKRGKICSRAIFGTTALCMTRSGLRHRTHRARRPGSWWCELQAGILRYIPRAVDPPASVEGEFRTEKGIHCETTTEIKDWKKRTRNKNGVKR